MKDALKNLSRDVAEAITKHFSNDEVQGLIAETKSASDTATGTFEVVITTENLDRYQEVIKLDAWELDNYLNNPVVLWAHDHTQPIGVCTNLSSADGKMVAKGKFAPNAKGQEVRQLYDAGIIRATSVGFIEKEREGNLITKAELLEFSFVSVPANPYALALAMERDLNINELVTKGLMFVEKDETPARADIDVTGGDTAGPGEDTPEERETPVEQPEETEERAVDAKPLSPVIATLKEAIVALEALGTTEEPEGDEPAEETDEERALAEFTAARRSLQSTVTILGDVLAEMRQTSEAKR